MPNTPAPTPDQGGVGADGLVEFHAQWANISFVRLTLERWRVEVVTRDADGISRTNVHVFRCRAKSINRLMHRLQALIHQQINQELPL